MYNHGERSNELFSVRSASLPNIFDYTRSCFCSLSVTRARFFPPYLAYVSTITSNRCVLKKSAVILLEISKLIPLDQSDREKEREKEKYENRRAKPNIWLRIISIQLVRIIALLIRLSVPQLFVCESYQLLNEFNYQY